MNIFPYEPSDDRSVARTEQQILDLISSDATPIFSAHLTVRTTGQEREDAEHGALATLSRIIPPLSPAWWRTWGGVSIETAEPTEGLSSHTLELRPH